jgi:hypothetical protein
MLLLLLLLLLPASGHTSAVTSPPNSKFLFGDEVAFVGRVQHAASGTAMFDMNGVQIHATVSGTTGLSVSLSQVQKVEGNVFQVYLNGTLQPKSRFNTSAWEAGHVVQVPLFPSGSLDASADHLVTVVKDTEPSFATTEIKMPNYITFHGFSGDSSARLLPVAESSALQHKVEFLGDSITAGFDNQCDIPDAPKGMPWSESFAKSWATLMCDELSAECHYNAWSGFGMVANCCGGRTLASDVWTRTIASLGSGNFSDPHSTVASNVWDFSKWKADAVVINLGTNDHLGSTPDPQPDSSGFLVFAKGALSAGSDLAINNVSTISDAEAWCEDNSSYSGFTTHTAPDATTGKYRVYFKQAESLGPHTDENWTSYVKANHTKRQAYKRRYLELVTAAAEAYGNDTGFFLACGPMSTDYCPEVEWVIKEATSAGIKAYLLNQSKFEDGTYGKKCAYGHPGSRDDAAMAKNGSAFVRAAMGW